MVEHLKNCLSKTGSKLTDEILRLSGMSTPNIRNLLNNIVSMEGARYLEVGVWRGATFVSALYGNAPDYACAVDDWSVNSRPYFDANVEKFIDTEFSMLSCDAFEAKPEKGINIYFYDAGHTQDDQYMALEYYYPYLADEFILIVDDYNHEMVMMGTQSAIKDLGFKVLFSKRLGAGTYCDRVPREWWLGLYVTVLKK